MHLQTSLLSILILTESRSATAAVTSSRCTNVETYWDAETNACWPCDQRFHLYAGYEFTPHCGFWDSGDESDRYTVCKSGTFNDGTHGKCQACGSCPLGQRQVSACSTQTDTICCTEGEHYVSGRCQVRASTAPPADQHSTNPVEMQPTTQFQLSSATPERTSANISRNKPTAGWAWLVCVTLVVLVTAAVCVTCWRHKRKAACLSAVQPARKIGRTQSWHTSTDQLAAEETKVKSLLSPDVQAAPLQLLLNNLDVLEQLSMLLDPECTSVKSTRHVAAHCGFPATWTNYAYSLRDTRSPLKALLEALVCRSPEWAVSDLAQVFADIERNDAVSVLASLPVGTVGSHGCAGSILV